MSIADLEEEEKSQRAALISSPSIRMAGFVEALELLEEGLRWEIFLDECNATIEDLNRFAGDMLDFVVSYEMDRVRACSGDVTDEEGEEEGKQETQASPSRKTREVVSKSAGSKKLIDQDQEEEDPKGPVERKGGPPEGGTGQHAEPEKESLKPLRADRAIRSTWNLVLFHAAALTEQVEREVILAYWRVFLRHADIQAFILEENPEGRVVPKRKPPPLDHLCLDVLLQAEENRERQIRRKALYCGLKEKSTADHRKPPPHRAHSAPRSVRSRVLLNGREDRASVPQDAEQRAAHPGENNLDWLEKDEHSGLPSLIMGRPKTFHHGSVARRKQQAVSPQAKQMWLSYPTVKKRKPTSSELYDDRGRRREFKERMERSPLAVDQTERQAQQPPENNASRPPRPPARPGTAPSTHRSPPQVAEQDLNAEDDDATTMEAYRVGMVRATSSLPSSQGSRPPTAGTRKSAAGTPNDKARPSSAFSISNNGGSGGLELNSCTTSAVASSVKSVLRYLKPVPPAFASVRGASGKEPHETDKGGAVKPKAKRTLLSAMRPEDILPPSEHNSFKLQLPLANAKVASKISRKRAKVLRARITEIQQQRERNAQHTSALADEQVTVSTSVQDSEPSVSGSDADDAADEGGAAETTGKAPQKETEEVESPLPQPQPSLMASIHVTPPSRKRSRHNEMNVKRSTPMSTAEPAPVEMQETVADV